MPVRASLRPLLAVNNLLERLVRGRGPTSVAERRAKSATTLLQMRYASTRVLRGVETTDFRVPVTGGEITVRRYRPVRAATTVAGTDPGAGPLPVHVFMHGGTFWLGSVAAYEPLCRLYAARVGCAVMSVEYRLAPEFPYPTGVEDCYAAVCWVAASAAELEVDATRLTVGGVSAGGTMAAAVCLMARDRSGPAIVAQILEIPATDLTMSSASIEEFAVGHLLTKASMVEGYGFYLADPAQAREAYASPLLAADLSGLPPAFVLTCECDPLRDEGEAYARRLAEAGVSVISRRVSGHVHGSNYLSRFLPSARRAVESSRLAISTAQTIARP